MAVNLYFDSKEVLRSLKGVGDKTADKIINLRRKGVDLTVERLAEATSISAEQWEEYLSEGSIILDKGAAMMTNLKELLSDMKQSIVKELKGEVKGDHRSSKQGRNTSGNSCSGKDFSKISGKIEELHESYQLKAQHMKDHLQDKIKQSIRQCEEETWAEYTQMTEEYRGQIRQLEEKRRQEREGCQRGRQNVAQIGDNLGGRRGHAQIGDNLSMGQRNSQIGDNLGRGQRHAQILGVGQIGDNLADTQLQQKQGEITQAPETKLQEVLKKHSELYCKKKKEWFRKAKWSEGEWSLVHPYEWDGYRRLNRKPCYVSQLWKEVKGLYMVILHAEQRALAEVSKASQSVRSRISEICSESYSTVEGELHEIASNMVYYTGCQDCLDTLIGSKDRISGWDKSGRCAECQNKGQSCLEEIQLGSIEEVGTQTEVQSRTSEQGTQVEVESVEEVGTQMEVQSRTSEQGTQVEVESVSRTVSSTQTTFVETKSQGTETSCEPERVDLGTQTLQETVDKAVQIVSTTMVQGVQTVEGSVQSDSITSITVGKDQLGMFETSSTVVSSSLGDLGVDRENLRYVTTVKLDSDQPVIKEVCRPDLIESVLLSSPKVSSVPIVSEGLLKPSLEILQEISCTQEISQSEPLQVSPPKLMGELVTTVRVTEELVETSSKLDPALKDHSLLSYQDFREDLHGSQDFPDIVEQLSFDMSNLHLETSSESNCVGLNC